MPSTSIFCGILLILIGLVGYIIGSMDGTASMTALIPAVFGVLLAGLGLGASASEAMRKHLMHAAVAIALLGFVAVTAQLVRKIDAISLTPAVLSQISMAAVCLVFVILAVRSFAAARRERAEP
jgi:hypothetical protein